MQWQTRHLRDSDNVQAPDWWPWLAASCLHPLPPSGRRAGAAAAGGRRSPPAAAPAGPPPTGASWAGSWPPLPSAGHSSQAPDTKGREKEVGDWWDGTVTMAISRKWHKHECLHVHLNYTVVLASSDGSFKWSYAAVRGKERGLLATCKLHPKHRNEHGEWTYYSILIWHFGESLYAKGFCKKTISFQWVFSFPWYGQQAKKAVLMEPTKLLFEFKGLQLLYWSPLMISVKLNT